MNIKKNDAEVIYKIIRDSDKIQNLIRDIVNDGDDGLAGRGESIKENLSLNYYSMQQQLQDEIAGLRQYKELYERAVPKLENYKKLNDEVVSLRNINKQTEQTLQQKESEIEKLHDNIEVFNDKIYELNNIIAKIRNENLELLSENNTVKNELEDLKKQFEAPVEYLALYRSLSERVRSGLGNVIIDTNEITFVASCSNEGNLSAIWEYIRELSNNSESEDFKKLTSIFYYCFEIFNQSLSEPKYEMDDVEAGDEFDDDYYDRSFGSATSGQITKVILRGYRSKNTGKRIHKSLVSI